VPDRSMLGDPVPPTATPEATEAGGCARPDVILGFRRCAPLACEVADQREGWRRPTPERLDAGPAMPTASSQSLTSATAAIAHHGGHPLVDSAVTVVPVTLRLNGRFRANVAGDELVNLFRPVLAPHRDAPGKRLGSSSCRRGLYELSAALGMERWVHTRPKSEICPDSQVSAGIAP
jgi:hypothetical protein